MTIEKADAFIPRDGERTLERSVRFKPSQPNRKEAAKLEEAVEKVTRKNDDASL